MDAVGLAWSATRLSTWVISSARANPRTIARSTSHRALPRAVTMIQAKRARATTARGTGRKSEFVAASTVPNGGGGSLIHVTKAVWASSAPGCSAIQ